MTPTLKVELDFPCKMRRVLSVFFKDFPKFFRVALFRGCKRIDNILLVFIFLLFYQFFVFIFFKV